MCWMCGATQPFWMKTVSCSPLPLYSHVAGLFDKTVLHPKRRAKGYARREDRVAWEVGRGGGGVPASKHFVIFTIVQCISKIWIFILKRTP